jgi:hypothetical protein
MVKILNRNTHPLWIWLISKTIDYKELTSAKPFGI